MFKPGVKIRTAYGKPWSKIIDEVGTSKAFLLEVGKILVKQIVHEGQKDLVRQGSQRTPRGEPEGLPTDPEFWKSFKYRVSGRNQVEIYNTWVGKRDPTKPPLIDQLLEGRRPYEMTWLTRERGIGIVPLEGRDGETIFRWAPSQNDPWIHPGFHKHNFVNRAFKKAKGQITEAMKRKLVQALERERQVNLT